MHSGILLRDSLRIVSIFFISIFILVPALVKATEPVIYPDDPEELKRQFIEPTYFPEHITKKPGHYTITDWDEVIDTTWGVGRAKSEKLQAFNSYWNWIDQAFACFESIPDYSPEFWNDLRTSYLAEIENGDPDYGVSKGRFAAILNHMALALREGHTVAFDYVVNQNTALDPGVPLFVIGGWGSNNHFGAGLTPLPDNSLLVYKAVPDHPLGLVPGDIVLGYDGIPWNELYPQMLEAQLPVYLNPWCGGSESAYIHSMLISAGLNWHLFDTIDILKYDTGETEHLSTSLLDGQQMELWCSEQMDIPGVPMPDINVGERASFGIIEGTQIGYIYVWAWSGEVTQEFYNAINTLMNDYETTGLIIDYRMNFGGYMHLGQDGYELLFNTVEPAYGWLVRCNSNDHLALCSNGVPNLDTYFSYIYGAANSYYDKPIAVLIGPGAISAGDFNSLVLKTHPMTRFFGKSAASAFNRPYGINMIYNQDWAGRYAQANAYLQDDPNQLLTRIEYPIDEEVWLSQDDVAQGYDTVVDAAVDWINSLSGNLPEILHEPSNLEFTLDPGEIVTQDLTIYNNGTSCLFYSLTPGIEGRLRLENKDKTPVMVSPANGEFITPESVKSSVIESTKNQHEYPIIQGHGGPDGYGYTWIDSHQPHGISPNWVDISGVGTPIYLTDDSFDGPFALGFDFQFYGNSYPEVYVSSNGFLIFGSGYEGWYNRPIPFSYSPNNIIAPWWDDLDPSLGGEILYYQDAQNGRFIVSYLDIEKHQPSSAIGTVTCQAILYADGQIEFNYLDMDGTITGNKGDYYTATIGIENINGSDGLQVLYNAGYFLDNFSVRITADWPAVSPSGGFIAPGEIVVAPVTISARYLYPGYYTGNIYLESDDPEESSIVIPVSLTVGGCGDYVVGDYNGSGTFNVADVIAAFGKLKGQPNDPALPCECPPGGGNSWAVAMDLNASCNFNIADVIWGFGKLKGQDNDLVPCPDCPPSGRRPAPGDDKGRITVEPRLKTTLDVDRGIDSE